MVGSVSTSPSYYSLLNPSASGSGKTPSVLDAISSVVDASTIGEGTPENDLEDSIKLSPEVKSLLEGLSGAGTGIAGALIGGTSSDNLLLNAAAKAAMKQAYASISASAYRAAFSKAAADVVATSPMDKILSAYHSALNGDTKPTTTTQA